MNGNWSTAPVATLSLCYSMSNRVCKIIKILKWHYVWEIFLYERKKSWERKEIVQFVFLIFLKTLPQTAQSIPR